MPLLITPLARRVVHAWRQARLARLGDRRAWRGIGDGLEMEIDPADSMDQAFYLGTYDPWLLQILRDVVRSGDHGLDLGAHKGYVTLRLAKQVGPEGRVFAFEPDPRARACLEAHCRRNRLSQVTWFPFALGRDEGEVALSLSSQLGWSSFFPNEMALPAVTEQITVPVRSIDALLSDGTLALDPERLTFIKVDTEGAEQQVLEGMRDLLAASRPMIWLEINRGSLAAAGARTEAITDLLHGLGFALYVPRRGRRLGVPRLSFVPARDLERQPESVFDVVACRDRLAE